MKFARNPVLLLSNKNFKQKTFDQNYQKFLDINGGTFLNQILDNSNFDTLWNQITGRFFWIRNEFNWKPSMYLNLRTVPFNLKFGDNDGPNLYRVNRVNVSSTFIENIFRSRLTLVSSNDMITIKINKKIC